MSTRFPLEELVSLPNFYLVTPSWQRDRVAFYWDKSGRIELYVMDLPDGTPRQISHGEVPRSLRRGCPERRVSLTAGGNRVHL